MYQLTSPPLVLLRRAVYREEFKCCNYQSLRSLKSHFSRIKLLPLSCYYPFFTTSEKNLKAGFRLGGMPQFVPCFYHFHSAIFFFKTSAFFLWNLFISCYRISQYVWDLRHFTGKDHILSLQLYRHISPCSLSVKQGIFYHKHNSIKLARLFGDYSVFLIAKSVTFP